MSKESPAPEENYMMFVRGFRDGARSVVQHHPDWLAYVEGYDAGDAALNEAVRTFCKKSGFTPSVLR